MVSTRTSFQSNIKSIEDLACPNLVYVTHIATCLSELSCDRLNETCADFGWCPLRFTKSYYTPYCMRKLIEGYRFAMK